MALNETLRKKLTPELYVQVMDALGDDFDFDMVPRARLNKAIEQRNALKAELEGLQTVPSEPAQNNSMGMPAPSSSIVPNNNTNTADIEALKLQMQAEQAQAIKDVRIQYAALDKLRTANVIDTDLIWNSNVLDKSKLDINEQGQLIGMDEMITALKESKPHLFKAEGADIPRGTGKDNGVMFSGVVNKQSFLALPVDQQIAFKQANPDTFRQFMNER